MRGYRALLAAGGPEQPLLLERILALASARPAWFFDGLELSRQALGRWPQFPPAHAALASITLAQGDAREAAGHLMQLAELASGEGDDDQAALAALAGARLLRVLEPQAGDPAVPARARARSELCRGGRLARRSPRRRAALARARAARACARGDHAPRSRVRCSYASGSPTCSCTSSTISPARSRSSRPHASSHPMIRPSTR